MDNKKYYYLKLKDNFFDSDEMIVLESMPDGHLYSNILLKLYLRSLKNNGRLMFRDAIPYNSTILAQVVRHQIGTVEKALDVLKSLGLIEILDDGAIYLLDIQNYIGASSSEADRIRDYRKSIDTQKLPIKSDGVQMYDKSTPEIEIKIELEKELELDSGKSSPQIIDAVFKNWQSIAKQHNIEFTKSEWAMIKGYSIAKPRLSIHQITVSVFSLDKWAQEGLDIEDTLLISQNYKSIVKPHAKNVIDPKTNKRLYGIDVINLRNKQIAKEREGA